MITTQNSQLPTLAELYSDNLEQAVKLEQFTLLLNQPPKQEWIKKHPFIKDYYYLPADKIEYLLKAIFKEYKIEITGQGTAFNGVWVTVRIHYRHPITKEWLFHDGIGAAQLQTAKGTSPADLANINNGALSMAFPIAKTVAIKDAADHFGTLFGSNVNRKDVVNYNADQSLLPPEPLNTDYIEECAQWFKTTPTDYPTLAGIIETLATEYLIETTSACINKIMSVDDLSGIAAVLTSKPESKSVFLQVRHLFTARKQALGG
ncbi:hypothetical protein UFOVP136_62 [uncultured Caudovirales phage]|uniref:Uncharacterized protein n=1 Tax=uncultured Caudovirales phage TaxID=2100421 RepID=A0A6J5LKM9_9CAUD|nr:hypothetical protein UFOVP136_62 [uncultured Caudovirales phage]